MLSLAVSRHKPRVIIMLCYIKSSYFSWLNDLGWGPRHTIFSIIYKTFFFHHCHHSTLKKSLCVSQEEEPGGLPSSTVSLFPYCFSSKCFLFSLRKDPSYSLWLSVLFCPRFGVLRGTLMPKVIPDLTHFLLFLIPPGRCWAGPRHWWKWNQSNIPSLRLSFHD